MMSGLEISEIKLSELIIDNEKYRFDSEFFQKIYIDTYTAIKKHSFKQLSALIDVLTDFHANGSYESIAQNFSLLDDPNYAYMVRSTDLEKSNYINDVKYVSEHSYNFLAKSKVLGGELLINKIGSPGRTYLMPTLNRPVSLGMNLFMIRLKNNSLVNNIFVWLFLNTSLGKHVINRKVNGTVPLTIDKEAIKSLPIPIVSVKFQKYLKHIVNRAESILNDSKALYSAAESRLLSALGMDNFTPSAEPVAVKSFSESFGTSGRLDAEYYQQKYDSLFHKIGKHACKRLGDLVKIEKSIEPGSDFYSDDGIPFVRVSDITKFGIQQPDIHIPESIAATAPRPKCGTILLSKDGSVGIAYKVDKDLNCVTSGALLHLTIKDHVLPDYLTLVLNSQIVQLQADQDAGGSIIQHWKPSEIEEVLIPILDNTTQEQIAADIQQSFALRHESERLLDAAKQAVEMAIEQGEDTAMAWLEQVIPILN